MNRPPISPSGMDAAFGPYVDRPAADPLDLVGPFRGECLICGLPDARHRLYEAIQEQLAAGDPVNFVADNYGMDRDVVERIGLMPRWKAPRRKRAKVPV